MFQSYFFVFFGVAANKSDEASGRIDQVILVLLVCMFFYCSLSNIFTNSIDVKYKKLNIRFLMFVFIWMFYALIYLNYGSIERVLSYLPTIMFVMLSFSYFSNHRLYNILNAKLLYVFTITSFLIVCFNFYLTLVHKVNLLGVDGFYKHSNNAGYGFVVIMPLLVYVFRRKKTLLNILLLFSYTAVLFSSKRGAILMFTLLLTLFIYNTINKQKSSIKKIGISIFSIIFLCFFSYIISDKIENILYRFSASGGSGRDLMYEALLDKVLNGNIIQIVFGHGFFSTSETTRSVLGTGQMAHNDFLEIIHDLGILGIIFFMLLYSYVIKIYFRIKKINKEDAFVVLLCLILWLMKMSISGVIMSKVSVFIFLTLGLVIGKHQIKKKY